MAKVNPGSVKALLKDVVVQCHRFPGTNSVVAHASFPDGFELAVASSPCVDPTEFNEEIGTQYAIQKVLRLAEDKIWEMQGIRLYDAMNRGNVSLHPNDFTADAVVRPPFES